MGFSARSFGVVAVVGALVWACGTSGQSVFSGPDTESGADGGAAETPPGVFVKPSEDGGGPRPGCVPSTCADQHVTCGAAGDGCGNVIACGTCTVEGETCGGDPTRPSQCGRPACAKKTCADLGAECGAAGDGCGGLIPSCGTCEAGTCGGGGPSRCGSGDAEDGGACVPTKSACGPGDCGPIADGCGGLLECPATCPDGQTCGGGGTPSVCGAPACVKKTCGTANCGFIADGCGGVVNCWPAGAVCPPGQSCGGAGAANECGTPSGCTNLCLQQQGCPGGGTTSIEGYVTSPNGVLPVPNAVVYVPNGPVAPFSTGVSCETCATASGDPLITTTTDANGHFFLPNMPVATPGGVTDIPVVVQLGRWRKQFTIATVACTNNLVPAALTADPSRTAALPSNKNEGDIPLTAISTGNVDGLECVFRKMGVQDSEFTDGNGDGRIRLYRDNGAKISDASPTADVLYGLPPANANGTVSGATNATPIVVTTAGVHELTTGTVVTISGVRGNRAANGSFTISVVDDTHFSLDGSVGSGAYTSNGTWSACKGGACTPEIAKYDAVIFGCIGWQENKGSGSRANVVRYANQGGRVFATHYAYVWLFSTGSFKSPWASSVNAWDPANEINWDQGPLTAFLDTSFPKGRLFSNWLQAPVAPTSATYAPPYGAIDALTSTSPPTIALTEPRRDITPGVANLATSGIVSPAQRWIFTTDDAGRACAADSDCKSGACVASACVGSIATAGDPAATDAPMHFTFDTDVTKPADQRCGRVLYSDFHVSIGTTGTQTFPAECDGNPLTSQEKVLAYMLFDLASCVSASGPTACVPKSCNAQGVGCGLAGDGCGGQLDCGTCPSGQTCGGGGVPSQCGAPACSPVGCTAGQCGLAGDGCGGTLDCGGCASGTCGGGGVPGVCGAGQCVPLACPSPAQGSSCGPVANGCGGVNNCPCAANVPCVNGTCGAPPCTPLTCERIGANCGTVADGCGATLDCGSCVAPQTCGAGGLKNVCGGGVN